MKRQIEIFVERNCPACKKVLDVVNFFRTHQNIAITIFEWEKNSEAFHERKVIICPATFINSKLAFYGEFTANLLYQRLISKDA